MCSDSWGCKESDTTERLNWTELNYNNVLLVEGVQSDSVIHTCICVCIYILFQFLFPYR